MTTSPKPQATAPARIAARWLAWPILTTCLGWLGCTLVLHQINTSFDRKQAAERGAAMAAQVREIRAGRINCLVDPDPNALGALVADAACAAGVRDVYLGGDVSDSRLRLLRRLPNLRCVVLLGAEAPDAFLEQIHGQDTIEEMAVERTWITRQSIAHIASLGGLRSLCLPLLRIGEGALEGIKNHPSLEKIVLTRAEVDKTLVPILQTLPRLREVTIYVEVNHGVSSLEDLLHRALPGCICRVINRS